MKVLGEKGRHRIIQHGNDLYTVDYNSPDAGMSIYSSGNREDAEKRFNLVTEQTQKKIDRQQKLDRIKKWQGDKK
jgi:hypothetical protein